MKIYETFVYADVADAKKIKPVPEQFFDYFEPMKCEVFDRFRFHKRYFGKIGTAKYFCSLDAASGFYQISLTEWASNLCTRATPKGRFRFLRFPFGLKMAPEVYLQVMSELFGDLPGVIIYFDDFLVTGDTVLISTVICVRCLCGAVSTF